MCFILRKFAAYPKLDCNFSWESHVKWSCPTSKCYKHLTRVCAVYWPPHPLSWSGQKFEIITFSKCWYFYYQYCGEKRKKKMGIQRDYTSAYHPGWVVETFCPRMPQPNIHCGGSFSQWTNVYWGTWHATVTNKTCLPELQDDWYISISRQRWHHRPRTENYRRGGLSQSHKARLHGQASGAKRAILYTNMRNCGKVWHTWSASADTMRLLCFSEY